MGWSCLFRALLVLALLVLSLSFGFSRKVMETVEVEDSSVQTEETAGKSREMVELLDYQLDPGPNTNPKTGPVPPPQG